MSPSTTTSQPTTRRPARTTAGPRRRRRGGQVSPASMVPGTFGMIVNVPWETGDRQSAQASGTDALHI